VNSRLFRCTEESMLVLGSMENSAVVLALLLTKVRARPFHKTSPFIEEMSCHPISATRQITTSSSVPIE
jgi:hypothetical protein